MEDVPAPSSGPTLSPPPPPSSSEGSGGGGGGGGRSAGGGGGGGGGSGEGDSEAKEGDGQPTAGQVQTEMAAVEARQEAAEAAKVAAFDAPADEHADRDDQIESDFFDTRQQFLNLCQGNHYQFDTLRRAKHTSMMTLYHVHNPDIPKFLTSCTCCGVDINSGYRYDCDQCAEFHLCHKCLMSYQANHTTPHHHRLKKVVVQAEQQGQLTDEQRRQRQRSIDLHMSLLKHAAVCGDAACPSANCQKMKNLLAHGAKCTTKVQGGCNVCRRIWALLQIHARQCQAPNCAVPKCRQLKEQLRSIELRQAAMDERRRLAMNEQYSGRPAAAASED
jgi:E1A/CREB-binding protein